MTEIYRYVRYQDVFAHEECGWRFAADLGRVHGEWSVLMIWAGEGEPS